MGHHAPQARAKPHRDSGDEGLRAGEIIAGRYELVAETGHGAMGSVWAAKHVALGSTVALKFLNRELAASDDARARFAREARVAAMLGERCRYIARVIDYGVVDGVGPFFVMEYLHGEELAEKMRRVRRLGLPEVVHIVSQLCRALDVAHAAGVVHRDIKPSNVFLARPHTNMSVFVKLMDFGVAKLLDPGVASEEGSPLTRVGAVIGTPAYMSPEQLLAQPIDARSDLFGVAAMTYRLLTGEFPFGSGSLDETGVRIVTQTPRAPSELVAGLPVAIDAWFRQALAKSPDERFQSASELAEALADAAGVDVASLPRLRVPSSTEPPAPELPESGIRLAAEPTTVRRESRASAIPRTRRRIDHVALAIALVVTLLAGGLALLAWSGASWPRSAPTGEALPPEK